MSVLKYFYFYRTPVVSVYVAAAADLQIGVTSQPCHQLTNIITYTPPSKFPQPNHGCHSMRQYIIAKTFNPINNSSCPVSHLSRPLHPKTTLSMNKIKHSLFRDISEIPSIRDSDKITHLYEKCALLFAQNPDYQWQGVR